VEVHGDFAKQMLHVSRAAFCLAPAGRLVGSSVVRDAGAWDRASAAGSHRDAGLSITDSLIRHRDRSTMAGGVASSLARYAILYKQSMKVALVMIEKNRNRAWCRSMQGQ